VSKLVNFYSFHFLVAEQAVTLYNNLSSMRTLLLVVILISSFAVKAQAPLRFSVMDYLQRGSFGNNNYPTDSTPGKKWVLSTYSSISTGYTFFNGGNAFFVSAPIGLQLNRRLTNNLYAFAGVSVAPAYVNFNSSFMSANINKMYPNNSFLRSSNFGGYARAEMGLMYINDAKTFSISGSIGIERSSSPVFINHPVNNARLTPVIQQNR
jgi:hypothetical protein